jgi:hypothetical protein
MTFMYDLVVAVSLLLAQPSQAPAIALDPAAPAAANVHWTITLSAPYCGGFHIGDGVYVQPEAPLALPPTVPADAVLFDGQAADVLLHGDVLRVTPSRTLAQSMLCQQVDRQFTVELLSSLGLANPDAGQYAVDVWLGSGGAPQKLSVTIDAPSNGCDPIQTSVDAATATLQVDTAALEKTFDAIRAQTAPLTAQAPNLRPAQTELVRQLAEVQASGKANAANGWNPSIGYAAPEIEWAQGAAQADVEALQQTAGVSPPSVATVISLVQLAQQQAQDGNTASQRLMDVLQQFADCGLGVPPTP